MAWRRPGDEPLTETMLICLLTHIGVTRPQWVNCVCNEGSVLTSIKKLSFKNVNYANLIVWPCFLIKFIIIRYIKSVFSIKTDSEYHLITSIKNRTRFTSYSSKLKLVQSFFPQSSWVNLSGSAHHINQQPDLHLLWVVITALCSHRYQLGHIQYQTLRTVVRD